MLGGNCNYSFSLIIYCDNLPGVGTSLVSKRAFCVRLMPLELRRTWVSFACRISNQWTDERNAQVYISFSHIKKLESIKKLGLRDVTVPPPRTGGAIEREREICAAAAERPASSVVSLWREPRARERHDLKAATPANAREHCVLFCRPTVRTPRSSCCILAGKCSGMECDEWFPRDTRVNVEKLYRCGQWWTTFHCCCCV
jgi:hypothetical protein